jgi:hypothetical protein
MSTMKILKQHDNGMIVVQTLDKEGKVTHNEGVVRLVYAPTELRQKVFDLIKGHLLNRGEIDSPEAP